MDKKDYNDLIYVCSLIEYIARETKNHRGDIVESLGVEGIERQLKDAEVNHCLSFEQVSFEIIEQYGIKNGDYDTISSCRYSVPAYVDIGKLYAIVIKDVSKGKDIAKTVKKVFSSFVSDAISGFNSDMYYQNPSYIEESYLAGELLS
ncbi:MAG: hypothetical protein IK152_00960 [Lachnospiraceae bacterium]|nr:hypothetical protein [Lachnospiraceae bacterium]